MKRILLVAAALVATAAVVYAQPERNDSLKTNSWSLFLNGGVAGFHDLRGIDHQYDLDRTGVSPAGEIGVFFYPRPWIRFGLGLGYTYLSSSAKDVYKTSIITPGYEYKYGKETYIGTLTSDKVRIQNKNFCHVLGTDLTIGIDFMEIWRSRKCQWFNIWMTGGIGYMHGWNKYTNSWAIDNTFLSDDKQFYDTHSSVESNLSDNQFDAPYVPLGLSVEFDVVPQFTIAAYGKYDYFPFEIRHTPIGIWTAGIGLRFNFVGKEQGVKTKNEQIGDLQKEVEYYKAALAAVPVPVVDTTTAEIVEYSPTGIPVVEKPLTHYAVQIMAFRKYQHSSEDKIFHGDNPTIYKNGDLRRYVIFTGTYEKALEKLMEVLPRYNDAFLVYIDDEGTVIPYSKKKNK